MRASEQRAVDIRIGAPPPAGKPPDKTAVGGGTVEAKLLTVRPGRHAQRDTARPPVERRAARAALDPLGGRVLVLLVPDASQLPPDLEAGSWRVFLRFARR